jgi:uncharacterized protein (TIGR04255 family)
MAVSTAYMTPVAVNVSYPRPPITEAIIDIQIAPTLAPDSEKLALIVKRFLSDYPEANERLSTGSVTIGTSIGEGGSAPEASTTQIKRGFIAFSPNRERAFQALNYGFSASKLPPYKNWYDLRDEAHRLWHGYKEIVQPTLIRRVALRYINRIDLPLPCGELKDFVKTTVEISPDLPQAISHFYLQAHLPQQDLNSNCIINSAIMPREQANFLPLLFDIDLACESSVPQEEAEIWNLLERMRDRKNEIFEASITDRTRELFR